MRHLMLGLLAATSVLCTNEIRAQQPRMLPFEWGTVWAYYHNNQAAADLTLTGKEIVVEGEVRFVRRRSLPKNDLRYGVYFGTGEKSVICWFDDPKTISHLKPKDVVQVKGTCQGWQGREKPDQGDVVLTKCHLIEKK